MEAWVEVFRRQGLADDITFKVQPVGRREVECILRYASEKGGGSTGLGMPDWLALHSPGKEAAFRGSDSSLRTRLHLGHRQSFALPTKPIRLISVLWKCASQYGQ